MRKKAGLLLTTFMAITTAAIAQTTYLPMNTEDYNLLDRLETKTGRLSDSLFLSVKPEMRNRAVDFLLYADSNKEAIHTSSIDDYNMAQMVSENGEWAPDENGAIDAKHPWFNTFYKKQYDFVHVKTNNFFLVINPIISGEMLYQKNSDGTSGTGYWSSRGAELRGWIAKKIGFYISATDNQEKPVSYVNNWVRKYEAVPGANYFLTLGNKKLPAATGYDYMLTTGYFDFGIIKDHLNVTAGFGSNFIGNGINSLFLSDFSGATPFLRLDLRIWKLNYECLYSELTPQFEYGNDTIRLHKYATMHHLSVNVTKWLNVGAFESVTFGRDHYEFSYMNPVIFLSSIEQYNGSADKKHIGFDFKALVAHHLQFYGQFLLDEFKSKEFFSHDGWWGNKWGLQLGGKYFDAFTVKNLDLQAELNVVRPYTYSDRDTFGTFNNYTNYNQPLAHPLGANFVQIIGIARYQPVKNLYLTLKGMYYKQGADTGNMDYGSNIFLNYRYRSANYGIYLLNGVRVNCALVNLTASYQLRRNLFIDIGATHRRYVYEEAKLPGLSTTYGYLGVRLNIARRDYDFY